MSVTQALHHNGVAIDPIKFIKVVWAHDPIEKILSFQGLPLGNEVTNSRTFATACKLLFLHFSPMESDEDSLRHYPRDIEEQAEGTGPGCRERDP